MRRDGPRDPIVGPDSGPENPFPLKLNGPVVKGFGRGSRELGIPTANIPIAGLSVGGHEDVEGGVYYGWAGLDTDEKGRRLDHHSAKASGTIFPMVMSIGWNPYYKNEKRSVEVHIMHQFEHDFYGAHMNLLITGFIRPEYDYVSRESLIEDIRTDIEVATKSLDREAYRALRNDLYLTDFSSVGHDTEVAS